MCVRDISFHYCYLSCDIINACLSFENISGFYQVMIEKTSGMRLGVLAFYFPLPKLICLCFSDQDVHSLCLYWQRYTLGRGHLGERWMGKVAPLIISVTPALSIFSQYREHSHSFEENHKKTPTFRGRERTSSSFRASLNGFYFDKSHSTFPTLHQMKWFFEGPYCVMNVSFYWGGWMGS